MYAIRATRVDFLEPQVRKFGCRAATLLLAMHPNMSSSTVAKLGFDALAVSSSVLLCRPKNLEIFM